MSGDDGYIKTVGIEGPPTTNPGGDINPYKTRVRG